MDDEIPQQRPPGTAIVPRGAEGVGSGAATQLLQAADALVGVAAHSARLAGRVGGIGWNATVKARRLAAALPGAESAGRLLGDAAQPLVDEGHRVRMRARPFAQARTQSLLDALVPGVIDALDVDGLVQRIDIDRVVRRIDIDTLVSRIDIDALVRRIEIDALVQRIDIDRLVRRIEIDDVVRRIQIDALVRRIEIDDVVRRIDVGEVVQRIDVNEVVQRVDVDAIVEETELGTIVARSTSGFASAALDVARTQTAGVDGRLTRAVNRVMRRKEGEVPVGPPLLVGDAVEGPAPTAATSAPEQAPPPERDTSP